MANNGSESEKAVKEVGFKFAKNQRVFCNHVTMMYEARIMDQEMRETIPCYLVHYHGWNKNWDEWVEEGRLVDYNDKNFKLAEELRVNFKVNKDSSQPKSTKRKSMSAMLSLTPSSSNYSVVVEKEGNDPKSGGNGKDAAITPMTMMKIKEEGKLTTPKGILKGRSSKREKMNKSPEIVFIEFHKDVHVEIPSALKDILVEDNISISQNQMLLKLPAATTVNHVLKSYIRDRCEKATNGTINQMLMDDIGEYGCQFYKSCYQEIANGLKLYFNNVLGTQLLYHFERLQYADLRRRLLPNETNQVDETNEMSKEHRSRRNSTTVKAESEQQQLERQNNSIETASTTENEFDLTEHYSVIYLLRLFTKLGKLFSYLPVDKNLMKLLQRFISDVIDYIDQNREQFFMDLDYYAPTSEYVRKITQE